MEGLPVAVEPSIFLCPKGKTPSAANNHTASPEKTVFTPSDYLQVSPKSL